ncbi:MAG: hypothetical protein ACTHMF_12310 [Leifsonia sp.]|uniref:hypothetical protein n=1 Tax=Leifsonia sp. TaxID=1870902 RepID=UPI003F7EA194
MSTHEKQPPELGGTRRTRNVVLLAVAAVVVIGLATAGIWWGVANGSASSPVAAESPSSPAPAPHSSASPTPSAPKPSTAKPAPTATSKPTAQPGAAGAALPQREPIALSTKTTVDKGVTVTMSKLEAVKGEASGPGEVAGPAIRFTLVFANPGAAAYGSQPIVVNAYYGQDNTPALPLSGPGATTLAASIPAHSSASATYVFTVPEDQRGSVTITVDYQAGAPAIAFQGAAPK